MEKLSSIGITPRNNAGAEAKYLSEISAQRHVRDLGWSGAQITKLAMELKAILKGFEVMTKGQYSMKGLIEPPGAWWRETREGLVGISFANKEILVFLGRQPEECLAKLPAQICEGLVELWLARKQGSLPGALAISPAVVTSLQNGSNRVIDDLVGERGVNVDDVMIDRIEREFCLAVVESGTWLAKWSLIIELLNSISLPPKWIAKKIDPLFVRLEADILSQQAVNENPRTLIQVSLLAGLSLLAEKGGYPEGSLKCRQALAGAVGERLSCQEFLELNLEKDLKYQRVPYRTTWQLKKGREGFRVAFEAFRNIFEECYHAARRTE